MHTLDKQGLGPGAGKCVSDSRGGGAARTTVAVQQVLSWVVLPWAVLTRVVPSWAGKIDLIGNLQNIEIIYMEL